MTKKPLDSPYYSIEQQAGSFDLYRTVWDLTGPVAVPILDTGAISYRFSGSYTNGGLFEDFLKNRFAFLAPAVTWRIDPSTTLTVDAEYRHQDVIGGFGLPAVGFYPASLPRSRSLSEPDQPPDRLRSALIAEEFKHQFDSNWAVTSRFIAERATYDQQGFLLPNTLVSVAFADPILNRTVAFQKTTISDYSSNLDLTGKFDVLGVKNDVLIGADYFYQFFNYILSRDGNFPIDIYSPIYGTVPNWDFVAAEGKAWAGTAQNTFFAPGEQRDLGIYAQDLISPFESLHILLGARYDLADTRSGASFTGDGSPPPTFAKALANFDKNPFDHNQALSPRVGVTYQPVPWIGFYGSYTKSFGVANGFAQGVNFFPEIGEGWEGGVKTSLLDRRLTATVAFLDMTKSNILTAAPTAANPFAQRPLGLVRSQGAELDVLGKLTNELSLIASYSHIDARIIKDNGGLQGKAPISFAPNSGSLFVAYDFAPGSELRGWRVGGGIYAASNRWGDDQDDLILPAYATFDAFARYQTVISSTRVSAQINLKNITDAKYYISPSEMGPGSTFTRLSIFPGAPRSIKGSLRVEF